MAEKVSPKKNETWPDLAIALYERLTGHHAEITYELENFEIMVPSGTGPDATHAKWILNGILKIRARSTEA